MNDRVEPISITIGETGRVSGLLQAPAGARACYVLAHGAGAGMAHPFMVAVAAGLAARGVATLRYQFPYMEQGGKRPTGASEAYREMIELELSRGRNAMGIWQDLVDKHGSTSSYQSVQRFVLKLRGAVSPEAREILETRPGKECQVDYGTGPRWAIPIAASTAVRGFRSDAGL